MKKHIDWERITKPLTDIIIDFLLNSIEILSSGLGFDDDYHNGGGKE